MTDSAVVDAALRKSGKTFLARMLQVKGFGLHNKVSQYISLNFLPSAGCWKLTYA
jgi:hypothetical protein